MEDWKVDMLIESFEADIAIDRATLKLGARISRSRAGSEIQRRGHEIVQPIAIYLKQRHARVKSFDEVARAYGVLFCWNYSRLIQIADLPDKNQGDFEVWFRWLCSKATDPIELRDTDQRLEQRELELQ